jgi:micrococcal nuclease|tara:strand:- start:800 stop:1201 length:402 start_codon:yes stop_codon:yes gene_type:complete
MYEYKCKIIKVIDGDTTDVDIDLGFGVWLKKQRIRFFGIDTPESRTRDLEEKKYGLAAKKYVTDRMPVGSIQTLVTVKDGKGKYGRILGQFRMEDGSILNENMIAEHHAVAYHGQSKEDIEENHIANREFVNL